MLKGIIRDGDNFIVLGNYEVLWFSLLNSHNLLSEDKLLRSYLWYMYSIDSPYYEIGILERSDIVYRYELSNKLCLEDFNKFLVCIKSLVSEFLGLFESQEERVYRELRERIDRLIVEYSGSAIDLSSLDSEPKKVKAISDLLKIKEGLGVNIGINNRNRGNRVDSLIENL